MIKKNNSLICDEMSLKLVSSAEKIAQSVGAEQVTVRSILKDIDITNRVFYNRFKNYAGAKAPAQSCNYFILLYLNF